MVAGLDCRHAPPPSTATRSASIFSRFKNRKLAEISTENAARLVTEMRRDGYAEWTIAGTPQL